MNKHRAGDGPNQPDLDTQIRAAEIAVIERDAKLRRDAEDLQTRVRGQAGRIAVIGAAGLATILGGALLLRMRARRGRRGIGAALHEHMVASGAATRGAPWWRRGTALAASFLSFGVRSALGAPQRAGLTPLVLGAAMPLVSSWWRARRERRQQQEHARD